MTKADLKHSRTLLIVETDVEIRRLIVKMVSAAGYKVKMADSAGDILQQIFSSRCLLVIFGMEAVDPSYLAIVKKLRKVSALPVVFLMYPGAEKDHASVSEAGVNDHVLKPFSDAELLTALRSVIRSAYNTDQGAKFETSSMVIDFEHQTVVKNGKRVNLTPTEFLLLSLFVHNAGKIVAHDLIMRQIRGPGHEKESNYSRVYTGRLRKKLEDDPENPHLIQTESGRGYRFVVTEGVVQ
jgi:two-component system KDP operon response regulator KdpE